MGGCTRRVPPEVTGKMDTPVWIFYADLITITSYLRFITYIKNARMAFFDGVDPGLMCGQWRPTIAVALTGFRLIFVVLCSVS